MPGSITGTGSLILGISLIQLAIGYIGTLIGIRLAVEKVDPLVAGIVTSAYFAGYVVGAVVCHHLIQRIGHIRAFAAFAALVASAFLVHPLYFDPTLWTVLRALAGFGCASLYVTTESWLAAKASPATRGKVFAIYMVAIYTTFAGGQFALNLASSTSFALFAIAAILLCVALLVVTTTRADAPVPVAHVSLKAGELSIAAPVAVAGCFAAGIINGAFFALVPVYAELNDRSVLEISSYMALAITGGLVFQIPVGRLSDRFDRRRVAGIMSLAFAGLALTIAPVRPTPWFSIVWLLLGGFMAVLYPICVAHANDRMAAERVIAVSGRLILIYGIGAALGPLLGSGVMSYFDVQGLFIFMAAVAALFALLALVRGLRVHAPPITFHRPYILVQPIFEQGIAHTPENQNSRRS